MQGVKTSAAELRRRRVEREEMNTRAGISNVLAHPYHLPIQTGWVLVSFAWPGYASPGSSERLLTSPEIVLTSICVNTQMLHSTAGSLAVSVKTLWKTNDKHALFRGCEFLSETRTLDYTVNLLKQTGQISNVLEHWQGYGGAASTNFLLLMRIRDGLWRC